MTVAFTHYFKIIYYSVKNGCVNFNFKSLVKYILRLTVRDLVSTKKLYSFEFLKCVYFYTSSQLNAIR